MYPRVMFSYGNEKKQITTRTFEVKCYPKNVAILKILLYRVSASGSIAYDDSNIHFIQWELRQVSSDEMYCGQMIRHNHLVIIISFIISLLSH